MTRTLSALLGVSALALLTASCLASGDAPDGVVTPAGAGRIAIEVAALDLPDVTSALYAISVKNLSGQTIASVTIDSADYGSGQGSATYVTPCDASADEQPNRVTATLVQLYAGATPVAAQLPPPLARDVVCAPNRDTLVPLDFTVIRSASQGFFDIKASVEDIFCSAKLDCSANYTPGAATTVVIGLACGAGEPALVDTHLYMSDILVDCGGVLGQALIRPEGDGYLGGGAVTDTDPNSLLAGVRVYRGAEQLAQLDAIYWNVTFGLTHWAAAADCSVSLQATATDGSIAVGPFYTAPYVTPSAYPMVDWDVPVTLNNAVVCTNHPVGGGNGVTVLFPADGWDFDNAYGGTGL